MERDCAPIDAHSPRCFASELAATVAGMFGAEVHDVLRGVAIGARGRLVADLVERGWTCGDVERWYGMAAGSASSALAARLRMLAGFEAERQRADARARAVEPAPAPYPWPPGVRPACACGRASGYPDTPSKRERRVAVWGAPEWVCGSCAHKRLRAMTRARTESGRLSAANEPGQDNSPENGK